MQGDSLLDQQTCRVCVGGKETTRNYIGIQDRKCHSSMLRVWCKEAEEKNQNSNTLVDGKHFTQRLFYNRCSKVHGLLLLGSHKEFGERDARSYI
ncbi:hypothetical protein TNCV_3019971 [Trichonephila clavipes]|nr:hypothetical protein TNCV_3019971 [Trichonephila clavipes]